MLHLQTPQSRLRPAPAGILSPDACFRAAQALWRDGRVEPARELLRGILARRPAHAEAADLLAKLLQSQGELDGASAVMAASCRARGLDAGTTLRCAQFIRQSQRQQLAAQLCEEAFARGSSSAALHAFAGIVYSELGDFTAARQHYLAALEQGVDLDAWFVLGMLAATQRHDAASHRDFARLVGHFRNNQSSPRARAASGFGLARAYDDIGDYASAADVLREANRLARAAQPWSRGAWQSWVDGRIQDTNAGPAHAPLELATDFVPIFVVGLPRSGTTLVALQLAKLAGVRDRGELPHIPYIARRLSASGRAGDSEALREAAALYRAHVRQDDAPARWYVDHNQLNFRHVDLIARLFPHARVIHCVRDRRDTALSAWSHYFASDDCAFANDLGDIAAFGDGHDRLMLHWKQHLDLAIHTVRYEDLVEHTQDVCERLRAFAGVPAGAGPSTPANGPAITSASMWQARQPIYRTSIGRWRTYAPHVPELVQLFAY